jgi:UDP-N-acetylmuramoyl-tripeptide--D-alanyl-D-alanine ligase
MSALWTSADIAAATKGKAVADFAASGVSIDSRNIAKGDLFVALAGPSFDGHDFIATALAAGAAGALVHRIPTGLTAGAPLVVANDTLEALGDLGRAARKRSKAKIVAVTGSVGKTSTKEALKSVLQVQAPTFATIGNLNNHWGAPLSLARMPRDVIYGVFELGMNHAGEIAPLSKMVLPQVAVITNVEAVHIEFFKSVAKIADAKGEIMDGLDPAGAVVLPRDNPHFDRLKQHALDHGIKRILSFGVDAPADVRLINCKVGADGNQVMAELFGRRLSYAMGTPGRHFALNSLAVLAAVEALGADVARAAASYAGVAPLKGRGKRETIQLSGGALTLIDESYNANPAAVRAALAVLGGMEIQGKGRRIAVLGDMRELGETGPQLHGDLAPDLVAARIDRAFLVGPLMQGLYEKLPAAMRGAWAPDSEAMIDLLLGAVRPGDLVLVKGSLGTRMAPLVEALRGLDAAAQTRPKAANGH